MSIDWLTVILTIAGTGIGWLLRHWQNSPVSALVDGMCKERQKQEQLDQLREQLAKLTKENEQKKPD